jgi:aspartyl-tRNA(Asn)/glutamyl-tRNA(Gln) amidotransferase subunit C
MALSLDDVRRIADLARIEVTDAEVLAVQQQLNGILALVGELQAADTAGIAPMAHALGRELRLREDVVTEADEHRLFQSIAPQVEAGLYLVPKVIE